MDSNVMPCLAARALLPDCLAEELTPSERVLLRGHLAACPACREQLAAQAAVGARLRAALVARTAALRPAPQARQRLLARLPRGRSLAVPAGGTRHPAPPALLKTKGAFAMNTRFVVGTLTALALSVSTAMAAPAVRAKVGAALKTSWHVAVDAFDGQAAVDAGADARVKAMFPTYLPAGEGWRAEVKSSTSSEIEMEFSRGEEFAVLTLTPLAANTGLEAEHAAGVTINGQAAGLQADLEGSVDAELHAALWAWVERTLLKTEAAAETATRIEYEDGRLLTWTEGDVRAQLLSNLALDEMVKVAESLEAAAEFNGDLTLALPQLAAEAAAEAEAEVDGTADVAAEAAAEAEAEAEAALEAVVDVEAAAEAEAAVDGLVDTTVEAAAEAAGEVVVEVDEALEVEGALETELDAEGEANGGGVLP